MEESGGRSELDEPAEVVDLRARSNAVRDLIDRAARDDDRSGDPRLVVGLSGMVEELLRLEPSAERSAWVMQPRYFYDPEEPGVELSRAAQARGVQTQLVAPPSTVQTQPLLPSIFPTTRLAPVFLRAMIVDEQRMLVGGRDTADGQRTSWYTARPDVVAAMLDLWRRTLALSDPDPAAGHRAAAVAATARGGPADGRGGEGRLDRSGAGALAAHRRARGAGGARRARRPEPG